MQSGEVDISEVESRGGSVSTLSGNLTRSNLDVLIQGGGLEATPAFKFRRQLGFTQITEAPTAANNYSLIMAKP